MIDWSLIKKNNLFVLEYCQNLILGSKIFGSGTGKNLADQTQKLARGKFNKKNLNRIFSSLGNKGIAKPRYSELPYSKNLP